MSSTAPSLAERLRELRRRHFGAQGKAQLAERLGVPLEDYARYERGTIPPADFLVRLCEATGEDLQWLLTGIAARGTVVIAGARSRHRDLLARLAAVLDQKPELAAPVEAFLELLLAAPAPRASPAPELAPRQLVNLIRIYDLGDLPAELPGSAADGSGRFPLALRGDAGAQPAGLADLSEPAMDYPADSMRRVELVRLPDTDAVCVCLHDADVADCFPDAFGLRLADDSMTPMFHRGDAVLVAPGANPKIGRPALCRFADEPPACCRIWLGTEHDRVQLGRLVDGAVECVELRQVIWSLEVLYRLAPAA